MRKPSHISILGGGPAGLAVGYYAKKNGIPFTIYEASDRIGGNCITLKFGDFLFDSGAHRFHDKDSEVTNEVKNLLGEDFKKINAPGLIYHNGKFIDFPFIPLNLLRNLGLHTFARSVIEVLYSRLRIAGLSTGFENFALRTYGKTIADLFLLNYSEKLWGVSCDRLSSIVAGGRMKGLNLRTFLTEAIFGRKDTAEHLEGSSFYYPKMGIGTLVEKLEEFCGEENILRNSKITKILHNHTGILAVEVNGRERIDLFTDEVVSTLPLNLFLQMMEPKLSGEILFLAKGIRFRNVILVAFFLQRESVTEAATVYFPDPDFPFVRIYEPKNRSMEMSPPGKTSLVAEIPCQPEDGFWNLKDDELIQIIRLRLIQIGWIKEEEIIDAMVSRINYGYPVLEIGGEEKILKISTFLKGFSNLNLSGRNGKFMYAWIHDMMKFGKEIIEEYVASKNEILK